MKSTMKLFHNNMSVCAQKVRMVLAYKDIDWESEHLNLRAGDQFHPDFKKINPKSVIPVLQHNGAIITESNAIIEYIEEVFPTPSLMPSNAIDRARVRYWMIKLDAVLHESIAIISFCVAFRFQMLERYKTQQELDGFLAAFTDPARAILMHDVVVNGLQSKRLTLALYAYSKLLDEMNSALEGNDWLVGQRVSLADYSLLPYLERLEQLDMEFWWSDKPHISSWLERIKTTPAYQRGMGDWHNQNYIALMKAKGGEARSDVKVLIETFDKS